MPGVWNGKSQMDGKVFRLWAVEYYDRRKGYCRKKGEKEPAHRKFETLYAFNGGKRTGPENPVGF